MVKRSWEQVTFREFELLLTSNKENANGFDKLLQDGYALCEDFDPENFEQLWELYNSLENLANTPVKSDISSFEFQGKKYSIGSFMNEPFVKLVMNSEFGYDKPEFHEKIQANEFGKLPDLMSLWINEEGISGFDHYRVKERAREFDKLGISYLLSFYEHYQNQMQKLLKTFKLLFKKYYFKNSEHYEFIHKKYGWELCVLDLCNQDVTKKESVYMVSIYDALNALEIEKAYSIGHDSLSRSMDNS